MKRRCDSGCAARGATGAIYEMCSIALLALSAAFLVLGALTDDTQEVVVDQVLDGVATIETSSGLYVVPLASLSHKVKEGDILDDQLQPNQVETERRREMIATKRERSVQDDGLSVIYLE